MDRRDFLLHCAGGAAAAALGAHPAPEAVAAPGPRGDRMAWWREARFGMFIHVGLYSGPGGDWHGPPTGAHDWMRHNARSPDDEYGRLADA
ncbi:MAG: alpha-L-fucosidase, partial [Gemmatimonadota bacterium]